MRKRDKYILNIIPAFIALLWLAVTASAQTATVSGTLLSISGQPVKGVQLKVTPLIVAGQLVSSIPYYTPASGNDGAVSFTVVKNSTINISGNALRFTGAGANFEIGTDDTISLDALVALSQVPTNGLTVYDETTLLSGLFGTFKFLGSGVTAARSAAGVVEVTIPGAAGGAWGGITGTLSNQTDLQSALDGKQPLNANLTSIANLTPSNDDILQRKGGVWVNRTVAQYKADLALNNVENTPLSTWPGSTNVTTLGNIASGQWAATNIPLNKGGTGASLSDPNAHTLMGWDHTDNAVKFFTIGSGLTYDHSTHTLSASGGGGLPTGLSYSTPDLTVGGDTDNQAVISGATTGNPVQVSAAGADTNISLNLKPKGSGAVIAKSDTFKISGASNTYQLTSDGSSLRLLGSGGGWTIPVSAKQFWAEGFNGGVVGFFFTIAEGSPHTGIQEVASKVVGASDGTTAGAGWFVDAGISRVVTQFDKTSSTSLANVTGLSLSVQSGRTYTFEATLYTTSNSSGGIKAAIGGTATATTIVYEADVYEAGVLKVPGTVRATSLGSAVGDITAVTAARVVIKGTITVSAGGTLTVQFAQNASNSNASSVLVGSTFIARDNP